MEYAMVNPRNGAGFTWILDLVVGIRRDAENARAACCRNEVSIEPGFFRGWPSPLVICHRGIEAPPGGGSDECRVARLHNVGPVVCRPSVRLYSPLIRGWVSNAIVLLMSQGALTICAHRFDGKMSTPPGAIWRRRNRHTGLLTGPASFHQAPSISTVSEIWLIRRRARHIKRSLAAIARNLSVSPPWNGLSELSATPPGATYL